MHKSTVWTRRRFTKAVVSAQLLLASGALAIPMGCSDEKTTNGASKLSNHHNELMRLAMDEIIPGNSKMPKASDIDALGYILNICKEMPHLGPVFIHFAEQIDKESSSNFDKSFLLLNRDKRITVLENIENTATQLFNTFKEFIYEAYYLNEHVWEQIGYESYPTGSAGPTMEAFDTTLLERVKNSSASFKNS